jgi:hypothetical protein
MEEKEGEKKREGEDPQPEDDVRGAPWRDVGRRKKNTHNSVKLTTNLQLVAEAA